MCNGGGSGSHGSGTVRYAPYLEDRHADYLGLAAGAPIAAPITYFMNQLFYPWNNPWYGTLAYNPATHLIDMSLRLSEYRTILNSINAETSWNNIYDKAGAEISIDPIVPFGSISYTNAAQVSPLDIDADAAALGNLLDDEINSKVLPRFHAGMRNINAVVASAFPIGRAFIEGMRDRDVAKHASAGRVGVLAKNAEIGLANAAANLEVTKLNSDRDFKYEAMKQERSGRIESLKASAVQQMMAVLAQKYSMEEVLLKTYIESKRIMVVAEKEQYDAQLKINESNILWNINVFQYGGNMMAAISGAAMVPRDNSPSKAQSAIGGAMSGAAYGAMIGGSTGNPVAAGAGAIIGGTIGFAQSFL